MERFTAMEQSLEARRRDADKDARRRERETRAALEEAAAARERETRARLEDMTAVRDRAESRCEHLSSSSTLLCIVLW
jgi:hypothetical protein